jgi:hypothetical protein
MANKKRICYFNACAHSLLPSDDSGSGRRLPHRRSDGGDAVRSGRARCVAALRGNEWVEGIAQGASVVKVSVADVRVEHEVKFSEFLKWLDRPPRSPRDVSARHEIRSILGMQTGR